MRYFGNHSLSSWLGAILNVAWYVVLVGAILGTLAGALFISFLSVGNSLSTDHKSSGLGRAGATVVERIGDSAEVSRIQSDIRDRFQKFRQNMGEKERKDMETFVNLPVFVKVLMFPYFWTLVVLLLKIIKRSRNLFTNFRNNILFNRSNVQLLSTISKLNIIFSIMTFSFSSLLASLFLLMACEVFKNGTVLQEEHDLTV